MRGPMRSSFLLLACVMVGCGGRLEGDSTGADGTSGTGSGSSSEAACTDRSLHSIASISATAVAIALDERYAYLALRGDSGRHNGSIVKVPLAGGAPIELSRSDESPMGVAVDDGHVYFTNGGAEHSAGMITRVDKDGTGKTLLASGLEWPNGIAVDDDAVYWTEGGNSDGSSVPDDRIGARVMRLDKAGGAPLPLATRQRNPESIAVDATHVYWTNSGGSAGAAGGVMRVSKLGGAPQIVARADEALPSTYPSPGLAIDVSNVYWTSTRSGRVMAVTKSGGAPRELSHEPSGPMAIATDGTFVYWTNPWTRSVRRAPTGGGAVETVAESTMAPWALASNGNRLFFTNYVNGGTLDSTCKPR